LFNCLFSLASGYGIHRSLKVCKRNKEPGEEYRSKKGFGDIKKKDKPDPYAYIPLTRCRLNQRLFKRILIIRYLLFFIKNIYVELKLIFFTQENEEF
jgi:hypothetical protein